MTRKEARTTILAALGVIVLYVSLIVLLPAPARAMGTWQQPYGGCKEAWQAPHSLGADDCRAHGWTIRARVTIGPRGWVHYLNLRPCRYEDGVSCFWNARVQGNGRGRSFVTVRALGSAQADGSRTIYVVTRSLPQP